MKKSKRYATIIVSASVVLATAILGLLILIFPINLVEVDGITRNTEYVNITEDSMTNEHFAGLESLAVEKEICETGSLTQTENVTDNGEKRSIRLPIPHGYETEDGIVIFQGWSLIPYGYEKEDGIVYEIIDSVHLRIERVDYSIKNAYGEVAGVAFYDKLVILEESFAANSINAFFENASCVFFSDKIETEFPDNNNDHEFFKQYVQEDLEANGVLTDCQPFYNSMFTEVKYNSNEIISVLQRNFWYAGGGSVEYCYGTTFDIQTGELISLDQFIDLDIFRFRAIIEELIIERLMVLRWGIDSESYYKSEETFADQEIAIFFEELEKMSYKDFNYYYDGDSITLLFNDTVFNGGCYLLKWDLLTSAFCDNVQLWFVQDSP